ncbi:MAG: c-type cytochrome [Polyangiaceae bacterium]
MIFASVLVVAGWTAFPLEKKASAAPAAGADGAALYAQYCSSCHGDKMKGSSAAAIKKAIDGNVGKMGSLKTLTPAQIAAIAAAH